MENEAERYYTVQQSSGLNKADFAASLGLSKAFGYQISTGRANAPGRPSNGLHWIIILTSIGICMGRVNLQQAREH